MKVLVDALGGFDHGERASVLDKLGASAVATIEHAGALAWLPAELNLRVTTAVGEVVGPERSAEFFRHLLGVVYHSSLMSSFIGAMSRLFGDDPASYAKLVPRGYGVIFRGVGRWLVDRSELRRVRLRLVDTPGEFSQDRWWPESVAAALGSLLDLAGRSGEVRLTSQGREELGFTMTWDADEG